MSDNADRLIARLYDDPAFRRLFHADPCAACRVYGLEELAGDFARWGAGVRVLDGRESRSGLAAVMMGAAVEAIQEVAPNDVSARSGGTGRWVAVAQTSGAAADYPGDDADPREIAAWMGRYAERYGLPAELPVMAALVESELRNLPYGDRASLGYFQMQTVFWLDDYPGYLEHPEQQMKWFVDRALAVRPHPESERDPRRWGEWVADIEKPDESLRWKYAERLEDARALLRDEPAPQPPATVESAAQTGAHALGAGGGDAVDAMKAEAERIDRAAVDYVLGGGHVAQQLHGSPVTPLDCSGAVSRVLGIAPLVAGDCMTWGEPGPGERVTIYAHEGHVLMEIDGRLWGTSRSNPDGGPGWIERREVGDDYLKRFTVRHPPGR